MKIIKLRGISIAASCLLVSGSVFPHGDVTGEPRIVSLDEDLTNALDEKIAFLSEIEPRLSALVQSIHSLILDKGMAQEQRFSVALLSVEKVVQIIDKELDLLTAQWDVTDEESLARREIEKKFTPLTTIRTTLASLATTTYHEAIDKIEKLLQTLPAVETPGDCILQERHGIYSQNMKETLQRIGESADHLDSTTGKAKTIVAASCALLVAALGICAYVKSA